MGNLFVLPNTTAVVVYRGAISGNVLFEELEDGVHITGRITGLTHGDHGFHIHECGDLRDGCDSACDHYTPEETAHGGLEGGHAGDLGNITADANGIAVINIFTDKFHLSNIVGRALIIHADADDLGTGTNEASKKTGNSGKRIACEIIGIASDQITDM
jgi:Cu-Zn family superoxide dismutase